MLGVGEKHLNFLKQDEPLRLKLPFKNGVIEGYF